MNENQTEKSVFEDDILEKFDNGTPLNVKEIVNLIFQFEISREDLKTNRGPILTRSVAQVKNRYFEIEWHLGAVAIFSAKEICGINNNGLSQ